MKNTCTRRPAAHDATAIAAMAAAILTGLLVAGCASAPNATIADEFDENPIPAGSPVSLSATGANGVQDVGQTVMRKSAMAAQAGVLFARSVHVDPINRPVSNFLTLSSLVLKSTTGLVHRTALGTIGFPALEQEPIPDIAYAAPMNLVEWERDLDAISGRRQMLGTIEFLIDGEEYFQRMIRAVNVAEKSIDIRTYIFDNDDYALEVADTLKAKSRDVNVRILVDAFGNMVATQADPKTLPDDFEGPLHMGQYLEQDSRVKYRSRAIPWTAGDHTKATIIDRKRAFVGGMNIGREYRYEWHDLMMEVTGPVVDHLQYDTDKAWASASLFGDIAKFLQILDGQDHDAARQGHPLRVLYTSNYDSEIYRAQLQAIRRSRSYILIENAYFSDDVILFELAKARRRGVDVRVILPREGNHASHNASNRVAINQMLRNGIRVYQYPGMSHVKAAIFDGWACVGSANFDKLSFQVNRELNLATSYSPVVDDLLQRLFIPDLARSTEIKESLTTTVQAHLWELVADEVM